MKITFIGSGNVAVHLSEELKSKGFEIIQIFSRTESNAKKLANILNTCYTNDLQKISDKADLYIISVSDDVLPRICKSKILKSKIKNKLVVHTSGSSDIDILKDLSSNYGIFYPLQTFSKQRKISFNEVPICIEANNKTNESILKNIANKISNKVLSISSEERKYIHIAAVFACNFTNYFYSIAEQLLNKKNIDFNILLPLINETTKKIKYFNPNDVQTGPAVRNDIKIIEKHLDALKKYPEYEKLYKLISKNITNDYIPTDKLVG